MEKAPAGIRMLDSGARRFCTFNVSRRRGGNRIRAVWGKFRSGRESMVCGGEIFSDSL